MFLLAGYASIMDFQSCDNYSVALPRSLLWPDITDTIIGPRCNLSWLIADALFQRLKKWKDALMRIAVMKASNDTYVSTHLN